MKSAHVEAIVSLHKSVLLEGKVSLCQNLYILHCIVACFFFFNLLSWCHVVIIGAAWTCQKREHGSSWAGTTAPAESEEFAELLEKRKGRGALRVTNMFWMTCSDQNKTQLSCPVNGFCTAFAFVEEIIHAYRLHLSPQNVAPIQTFTLSDYSKLYCALEHSWIKTATSNI